ncbi:MAG: pilus assembly FimT family protein [Terriglobales bacterium]
MTRIRLRSARGFSILELIIVVAITLTIAAIAIPKVVIATQDFKLRSTASSLSGLVQKCRMLAVARNIFNPVTYSGGGFSCAVTGTNSANVLLPSTVVVDNTGGGFSTSSMSMSWTSSAVVGPPEFNPRGLPCVVPSGGGQCAVTGQGYIYYLRQDRAVGATGWAAITVTPAGRARVWTWDGNNWQ